MPVQYVPLRVNDLYLRKMRTFFSFMDTDKDGNLTRKDYELLADRYVAMAKAESIREKQMRRKILGLWTDIFEEMSKKATITPEVWAQCIANLGREGIILHGTHFSDTIFDMADMNMDGIITRKEYEQMLQLFFVGERDAELAFNAMDFEGKGSVRYRQFTEMVIDFFLPDNEEVTPSALIFGPLKD